MKSFRRALWNLPAVICFGVGGFFAGAAGAVPAADAAADAAAVPTPVVRVVVARSVLPAYNESDALGAIRAWLDSVARERDLRLTSEPRVVRGFSELARLVAQGDVDLASIPTADALELAEGFQPEHHYAASVGNSVTEEYVIVVPAVGGARDLAELQGRRVLLYRGYESSLVVKWLEVLLADRGLPRFGRFFADAQFEDKPSRAVLPVFFGRAEATVVTRSGFDAMVELNPQVGSRLRVIETSPMYIPTLVSFGRQFVSSEQRELIDSVERLHLNPKGQQVLLLFKADRMVRLTPDRLAPTKALLERYATLRGRDGEVGRPPQEVPVP